MDNTRDRSESALYESDFHTWTEHQAAYLRQGRYEAVDLANVAEEIEALGRSQLAALRSSYRLIAMHLLKLMHQPERATASRENTINRERGEIADLLDDNPGLKPKRAALFAKAYASARADAAFETRLAIERFPEQPPFSFGDVEAKQFWPAGFPRRAEQTTAGG